MIVNEPHADSISGQSAVFCAMTIVLFVISLGYGQAQSTLQWTVRPKDVAVIAGAPLLLSFDVANKGDKAETVYFWEDNREPFRAELVDCNGRIVSHSLDAEVLPSILEKAWGLFVPPGKTATRQAVLNQFCSTRVPPGRYSLHCRLSYFVASEEGKKRVVSATTTVDEAAPLYHVELVTPVEILPPDPNAYSSQLMAISREMDRLRAQHVPQGQDSLNAYTATVEMLAFAEGDTAVPYQGAIIREDNWGYRLRYCAMIGLQRNGSLAAVRQLEELVEDPDVQLIGGKDDLIRAVYAVRDRGNAMVRNTTEEFARKHPRPPAPPRMLN